MVTFLLQPLEEFYDTDSAFLLQNWDRMEKYGQLCYAPTPSLRLRLNHLNVYVHSEPNMYCVHLFTSDKENAVSTKQMRKRSSGFTLVFDMYFISETWFL